MIAKGVIIMQGSVDVCVELNRMLKFPFRQGSPGFSRGFTIIESMVVMVIIAIALTLALPSFKPSAEKRQLVSAAEQVVSFMTLVQSEAIKHNDKVSVSWSSPGGHGANWCIGASAPPKTGACDCMETVTTEADFCSIDSVPYRLVQSDFVDMSYEFMHMQPTASSFAFDPVSGIVVDIADAESVDGDWLFLMHSDMTASGSNQRLFELQVKLNTTGRASICSDDDRYSMIGGYPVC